MRWLFIHQHFPGQYLHVARYLASTGHEVVAIGQRSKYVHPNIRTLTYAHGPEARSDTHRFARSFEAAVRNGQAVGQLCETLKREGFEPDLVVGHNGWGEILFVKDVWPSVPLLGYFEFFYKYRGSDVSFDPEYSPSVEDAWRIRSLNATNLLGLDAADAGQTPTHWQRSLYPREYANRIAVLHEGVDTGVIRPAGSAQITLGRNLTLRTGDPVVTFSARNLEPYRGFHIFMRSLVELQKMNPSVRVVIVGGDKVSYGRAPRGYASYREQLLRELQGALDLERIHFVGTLPYNQYLNLLYVSAVHVYLTYPFVLSWSLLEALAAGCVVVGSRTPPVEEVIEHGRNGFLADFFDVRGIASQVDHILRGRSDTQAVREEARRTVMDQYDLHRVCLPAQLDLFEKLTRTRALA